MRTSNSKTALLRIMYGVPLIGWGSQHILFDDFIAGRAPAWPGGLPGQMGWAYTTGLLLIMSGISVILDKKARLSLLISGMLIICWAALRNTVAIAIDPQYGGLLTNLFKSLSIGWGAFIVAASFSRNEFSFTSGPFMERMASVGIYMVAGFLFIGGVQHFIFVDFVKFLVPAWIPGSEIWTYVTGAALITGGLGIMITKTRRIASLLSGLMIFIWLIVLHIPRGIENQNQNEWTAVFEAMAVSGILLIISEQSRKETAIATSTGHYDRVLNYAEH